MASYEAMVLIWIVLAGAGVVAGCAQPELPTGPNFVGDLRCAGLTDVEGNEVVPRVSSDGCVGGLIEGVARCDDCEFVEGWAQFQLFARFAPDADDPVRLEAVSCGYTEIGADGSFSFGRVAPHEMYSVDFTGSVMGLCYAEVHVDPIRICSGDSWLEPVVDWLLPCEP